MSRSALLECLDVRHPRSFFPEKLVNKVRWHVSGTKIRVSLISRAVVGRFAALCSTKAHRGRLESPFPCVSPPTALRGFLFSSMHRCESTGVRG